MRYTLRVHKTRNAFERQPQKIANAGKPRKLCSSDVCARLILELAQDRFRLDSKWQRYKTKKHKTENIINNVTSLRRSVADVFGVY
mgnify:CR=1 FL=1